ncbi:MAG: putative AsmA-like C-terminal region [Hyphomicrobiales bacterium]|nr:putative AsmA-like C-terminal region [Hyphomicrobiales bacterium]
MRDLLTIIASFLILVLTLALVGPWFVDWTAQRGWVESELTRVTGVRVRVAGDIDLKLLPIPSLSLKGLRVTSSRDEGPSLDVASVRLELAAASLLRGELRFTDADLERPQITLSRYEGGTIVLPRMPNFAPSGVQIERLSITEGSIAFRAEGQTPTVIGGLEFTGEAASLAGPFKGSGSLRAVTEPVKFRFTTGQIEGDRLRLKMIVDESAFAPRADLEGALFFLANGLGALPNFEGTAAFSGTDTIAGAPVAWRLAGALKADATRAAFEAADLRAGDEDRAVAATGAVALSFAPALRLDAKLVARQLDFDKLFASGGQGAPAGQRLAALLAGAVADDSLSERLPFPLAVSLTSPTATLAGESLTDLRGELALASGQSPRLKLAMIGPARSALSMDGAVETGAAAAFRGRVDLSARDLRRLSDWLALSVPDEARRLRDLPFRSVDLAGDVEISAAGAVGRKLALRLDRSELAGAMSFTRATAQEPARLFADLTSDALDLEGLPELAGPARLAADMDLSLALDARAVRLERFGAGFVDAGRIGLKFVKDPAGSRLEKFAIENIGGANVSATGRVGANGAQVDARLDAARLGDLAALVQRIAPGPFAEALAKRATALSPARLTLAARGKSADTFGDIQIEGTARGTKIDARSQGDLAALDIVANAESADAVMLLRQLGFETLPLSGIGAGRVTLRAKGSKAGGFETAIVANAARGEAGFDGRIDLDKAEWRGNLRLRSPDAAPLLRALAVVLPDADASLPVDGAAQAEQAGGVLSFKNLSGLVSGAFVNGALRGEPEAEGRRWSGDLKLDRVALADLSAFALGPLRPPTRGASWSDQKFGPGLAEPPRIDLRIAAGAFDLSDSVSARDAAFDLHIAPGVVGLDNVQMALGAGKLAGQLALRRDGPSASLAGKLDLVSVASPTGPVSGAMTGHVEFTSTGQSALALAGGLAGGGRIVMNGLTFVGADAAGITRLIEAADGGKVNVEEVEMRGRLLREFEAANLRMEARAFDASIAAGLVRLASTDAPRVEMSWDLRQPGVTARVDLTAPRTSKDWTGGAPVATLVWQGRPGAIQRAVDAGPLFNAISARAIAREAARVEALEADIRERAYFNRRAKAFEFIRRRDREVAVYLDEQRRAEAEDARRKAEEDKQREAARLPADSAIGRLIESTTPPDLAQRRRAAETLRQRAEDSLRSGQPAQRPAAQTPPIGPMPGALLPMPRPALEDPLSSGRY